MITQYEVPGYLTQQLPAFTFQPRLGHLDLNIYKELQHFTDYTRQAIDRHNYLLARKCFRLDDKLYGQGDITVKNAMENIFVYSFSSLIPEGKVEKGIQKSLIPATLYSLYLKQIYQTGC
jgi:hypothetical protein